MSRKTEEGREWGSKKVGLSSIFLSSIFLTECLSYLINTYNKV
jgi:hypothetical protein